MNLDDLTIKEIRQLTALLSNGSRDSAYELNRQYFIRTATYFATGLLIKETENELVLSNAAWIADTGRLNEALTSGEFKEVEPFPNNLIINKGGIIDATFFGASLPTEVI